MYIFVACGNVRFLFLFLIFILEKRGGTIWNIIRNCCVTVLILKSIHQGIKIKEIYVFHLSFFLLEREEKKLTVNNPYHFIVWKIFYLLSLFSMVEYLFFNFQYFGYIFIHIHDYFTYF